MPAWADVAETHTAAVFFAGDRALKVKKPLLFDFVDLRSPAERLRVCEQEVELNRRLAPDVYLGVARLRLPDGSDEPAVVMRRLPRNRRLRVLVTGGSPEASEAVRTVARLMAAFHESQEPQHPAGDRVERMRRLWQQVLNLPYGVEPAFDAVAAQCRGLAERYLSGRAPLFTERLVAGRIRDGHGDLQADDIFVLDDGPRILDCLEFDDDLRVDDVLLDICFLAMDLERVGAPQLSRLLLDDYRELAGESHPASLEHFYVAYRAAVRMNVTLIRAGQGEEFAVQRASALLQLSHEHLLAAVPVLLLVGGLPGSGKTTVADAVTAKRPWMLVSSDVVRKQQHGQPLRPAAPAGWGTGIYSDDATAGVYAEMVERARVGLQRGESVVLDASWADPAWRQRARDVAARTSAVLVEACCVVPDDIAAERLADRRGGASDASVATRTRMAAQFAAWPEATEVTTQNGDAPARLLATVDATVLRAAGS